MNYKKSFLNLRSNYIDFDWSFLREALFILRQFLIKDIGKPLGHGSKPSMSTSRPVQNMFNWVRNAVMRGYFWIGFECFFCPFCPKGHARMYEFKLWYLRYDNHIKRKDRNREEFGPCRNFYFLWENGQDPIARRSS
jgi:hypothetical protein